MDIINSKCCLILTFTEIDPYVIIRCEGESVKSNFCRDTLNPEWLHLKAIFYRKKPSAEPIYVEVRGILSLKAGNLWVKKKCGRILTHLVPFTPEAILAVTRKLEFKKVHQNERGDCNPISKSSTKHIKTVINILR